MTVRRRSWPMRAVLLPGLMLAAVWTLFFGAAAVRAQSAAASLNGAVADESGGVVPDVVITVESMGTGLRRSARTSREGTFSVPLLPPGRYLVTAQRTGFMPIEVPDVLLNLGDQLLVRLQLKLDRLGEAVTVAADPFRVSTSPAISTVIDRQFVDNLPLNGRSLHSLLELTPGVTLFRANTNPIGGGQFSVNGQRTNANYFMVDGVGANTGISTGFGSFAGHSAGGALPGLTALGSTQSLVSIDALQEFRIQTSTFAPEYGRTPGGQISMLTRSGTNEFRGSIAEYFRDDVFDATDWFANNKNRPKPQMRQHDVGLTLGGPIVRNQTFFFSSYEALRLDLPQVRVVAVPTLEVRESMPAAVRELFDAMPLPNGASLGGGLAEFSASYTDPSRFDSASVRLDHSFGPRVMMFARVNHAPSVASIRTSSLSTIATTQHDNDAVTAGATWIAGATLSNDVRVNWTRTRAVQTRALDGFGGAIPPPSGTIFPAPLTFDDAFFILQLTGTSSVSVGTGNDNIQRQFNVVDTLTWIRGEHQIKTGIDYRTISPILNRAGGNFWGVQFGTIENALAGQLQFAQIARGTNESIALYRNFSAFVQDSWTATPRLTLTYGVRWEVNPPPTSPNGRLPLTLVDTDHLVEPLQLAPRDTPLWRTTWTNFGPRAGLAYRLSDAPGRESILRGGAGLFHDTGVGLSAVAFDHIYPWFASKVVSNVGYPLDDDAARPPVPGVEPAQQFWVMDRDVKLPYSWQWNTAFEQALGPQQSVRVSYVGALGRRLLRREGYSSYLYADFPARVSTIVQRNGGRSEYAALQLQYQRRLYRNLQALASYTLSSSSDTVSDDAGYASSQVPGGLVDLSSEYGPSDFDVRHVFSGALTYEMRPRDEGGVIAALAGGWGFDSVVRARSGFPLNVLVSVPFGSSTYSVRPTVVPGEPLIIEDGSPGGWRVNRAAFATPAPGTVGNYPRNSLRGFPVWQADVTLRRQFTLAGRWRLQIRAEVFNVFNHANFADPGVGPSDSPFGISTQMLGRGLGGLSALYQIGGPRSAQLVAKLLF